jgi:hypothetical protein
MKKALIFVTTVSLMMLTIAQAQIGWTLDQCKAKYGAEISGDKVDSFVFQVSGFKITTTFQVTYLTGGGFNRGGVEIIEFEPETPITFAQAKQILTKVSNTAWKRDSDPALSDEELDTWETKMTTEPKHNLNGLLAFAAPELLSSTKPDRTHIESVTVQDDTAMSQDSEEGMRDQAKEKAKEEKKTQDSVDGL